MCQQPSLPWTPTHKEHLRLECLYTETAAKIVISLATGRFRNSLLRFRNNIFLARWNAVPNPSRKNVPQTRRLPAQSSSKKHEVVNLFYTGQQLRSAQCAQIFKMVQFFHTTYLWVSYDSQNKTLSFPPYKWLVLCNWILASSPVRMTWVATHHIAKRFPKGPSRIQRNLPPVPRRSVDTFLRWILSSLFIFQLNE